MNKRRCFLGRLARKRGVDGFQARVQTPMRVAAERGSDFGASGRDKLRVHWLLVGSAGKHGSEAVRPGALEPAGDGIVAGSGGFCCLAMGVATQDGLESDKPLAYVRPLFVGKGVSDLDLSNGDRSRIDA